MMKNIASNLFKKFYQDNELIDACSYHAANESVPSHEVLSAEENFEQTPEQIRYETAALRHSKKQQKKDMLLFIEVNRKLQLINEARERAIAQRQEIANFTERLAKEASETGVIRS